MGPASTTGCLEANLGVAGVSPGGTVHHSPVALRLLRSGAECVRFAALSGYVGLQGTAEIVGVRFESHAVHWPDFVWVS